MKYMYVFPREQQCSRPCPRTASPKIRIARTYAARTPAPRQFEILDEDRLTLGTATPRNCSKSPRGSRSPSRPGMSLSRVSLARAQNNFELRLTFCDRSPSKPLTIRIRRSLLTTSRASSQSLSVTWRSASHTYVGFPVAQWKHKLRLLQPKKNVIKIELHHGSRKSVATIRTVRTLIVCCDPRYGGDVSGNTGKG
jgi:hypothetical protein